jgi:flagellar basal-body rod protein FlgF
MDSGYYAACAGLAAQTQALELLAHNLANLSTTGYRGEQTTFRALLTGRSAVASNAINRAINDYGVLSGSRLDLGQGTVLPTGNPLDVAVSGKGFFTLQTGQGAEQQTLYTRDGSFHLTGTGQLVTVEGASVMGQAGPVTLPLGSVSLSPDGTISVDGNVVDRLKIAEFAPGTNLEPLGATTYTSPADPLPAATESTVQQGMLEGSNVTPTEAIVQLIAVQRNTEMLGRAVNALDGQLNAIAVQDLPKV